MIFIKKLLTALVTLPGFIILILFLSPFFIKGNKSKWIINICTGLLLYMLSIVPVSNSLTGMIEEHAMYKGKSVVDVLIILGGSFTYGIKDISGEGMPRPDVASRIIETVRLYRKYKYPIIVSGGGPEAKISEAEVIGRFLVDLGVKKKDIILEKESSDTVENALFVKSIFHKRRYKKGILITSAYHLKRASFIFKNTGVSVIPHSAGSLTSSNRPLSILDFLPNISCLKNSTIAIREGIGVAFYKVKYLVVE